MGIHFFIRSSITLGSMTKASYSDSILEQYYQNRRLIIILRLFIAHKGNMSAPTRFGNLNLLQCALVFVIYSRFSFLVIMCRLTKYMITAMITFISRTKFNVGDSILYGVTSTA